MVDLSIAMLNYQRVTITITIPKPPSPDPISPSGAGAAGAIPPAMVDPRLRETRQSKLLCAELLGALVPWWLVVDSTTQNGHFEVDLPAFDVDLPAFEVDFPPF